MHLDDKRRLLSSQLLPFQSSGHSRSLLCPPERLEFAGRDNLKAQQLQVDENGFVDASVAESPLSPDDLQPGLINVATFARVLSIHQDGQDQPSSSSIWLLSVTAHSSILMQLKCSITDVQGNRLMTGQWVFVTGVRIEERSRLSFEALPLPVRRCLSSRSGDGNAAKRRHDVITGSTLHRDGYNSEEGAGQRCVYNISSFASRNNSPGLFPPASCVPRSQVDGPLLVLCYLKASFAARDSRKRGRSESDDGNDDDDGDNSSIEDNAEVLLLPKSGVESYSRCSRCGESREHCHAFVTPSTLSLSSTVHLAISNAVVADINVGSERCYVVSLSRTDDILHDAAAADSNPVFLIDCISDEDQK